MGQSGPLDGQKLFNKINRVLSTCGHARVAEPPPRPEFRANPVVAFTTGDNPRKLALTMGLREPPLEEIMLFASPPRNPGRIYEDAPSFIGLLPAGAGEGRDVTGLYLKKLKDWRLLADKRYHVPLRGARIFIRAVQQVNGWENELGMFRASALVPVPRRPAGGRAGA